MSEITGPIFDLALAWGPVQFLVVALVLVVVTIAGGSLYANWRLVARILKDKDRGLAIKLQLRDAMRALRKAFVGDL